MEEKKEKTKPKRNAHRPISVLVESVRPTPMVRELPHETQMYINLKGDKKIGEALIAEIRKQIDTNNFFAVEIQGPS